LSKPKRKELHKLIQSDRVHRRVYTDPAIFDLEMDRIFGKAWLYVGHESQIPAPGDYFTTDLARQAVVVLRHSDGTVRVLFNRCSHRGAKVCEAESGHAKRLQCPYHGWTYDSDGRFLSSAYHRDYLDSSKFDPADLNLRSVPRATVYRGFVFASLATVGPSLADSLGPITSAIDNLVDRAPAGRVTVLPGVHRHVYRGNWKMQVENLQDAAHPPFVHESSNAAGSAREYEDTELRAEDFMVANASAATFMDEAGLTAFPGGHSYTGALPIETAVSDGAYREYVASLEEQHGAQKTKEILGVARHYHVIYPQLMIQAEFQTIKVLRPVTVDRTELTVYLFRLEGAPAEFERAAIQYFDATNSAASPILTDDLSIYENAQEALSTSGSDWVLITNGLSAERTDVPGCRSGRGLSELPMRNQFAAWRSYMCND